MHRRIMAEAEMFSSWKNKLDQNSRVGIKLTDFFFLKDDSVKGIYKQWLQKKNLFNSNSL